MDHFEHGWSIVDKYTADNLVDDLDNECQIEKAERAAERKAGNQCKKCSLQVGQVNSCGAPAAGMQKPAVAYLLCIYSMID